MFRLIVWIKTFLKRIKAWLFTKIIQMAVTMAVGAAESLHWNLGAFVF
jgi:hypothetical protein